MKALEVTGCAVQDCPLPVAAVAEVGVLLAGDGYDRLADVPLCAAHAEAWSNTPAHPSAMFTGVRSVRRAVVVTPHAPRGRWPTYQELVSRLARGEVAR